MARGQGNRSCYTPSHPMTMDSVFYLTAGGALLLSLVLAILLLRRGPGRSLAEVLLVAILAAAVLNILHALTVFPAVSLRGVVIEPLQFVLPPLFAGYVRALLVPGFRVRARQLLHFVVALVAVSLALVVSFSSRVDIVSARGISIGLWIALLCQALVYLRVAMRDISRYREALKSEVSSLTGVDPAWLRLFSWILHAVYLLYVLVPFLLLHLGSVQTVRNLISLVLSLSMCALCLRQLLGTVPAPRTAAETKRSYPTELPGLLEKVMDGERLFLNPDLDLDTLARRTGWSRNDVSAAINGHFNQNFYDFVNSYRVREVKARMTDPASARLTLYALALEAGFNSKPTFNAVFKKLAGVTPSAFYRSVKKV